MCFFVVWGVLHMQKNKNMLKAVISLNQYMNMEIHKIRSDIAL